MVLERFDEAIDRLNMLLKLETVDDSDLARDAQKKLVLLEGLVGRIPSHFGFKRLES